MEYHDLKYPGVSQLKITLTDRNYCFKAAIFSHGLKVIRAPVRHFYITIFCSLLEMFVLLLDTLIVSNSEITNLMGVSEAKGLVSLPLSPYGIQTQPYCIESISVVQYFISC